MYSLESQINYQVKGFDRVAWPKANRVVWPKANQLSHSENKSKIASLPSNNSQFLLQAILEGFVDGVLILTSQGKWVHANERGLSICRQLCQDKSQMSSIPESIWRVCEGLIDSRDWFSGQKMILESEIKMDNSVTFRVRVRWLFLDNQAEPYLLVTLENRHHSYYNAAITDAKKYGLTNREAEVWLLKKAKMSYKEIAARLYITTNTVKKHLKNIYAKQQALVSS
ncbi:MULTISPECIES: helix-turn-helix transcriptional regulator [Moorena]|uniref:Two-component response regulator, CheY subfamily n=1 Tax=Moorena producens 3L TaxID=489825 RepID=F4XTI9_9CYAN|nr:MULTISPECIES: helix-turn-helix transcriptional regulator [Moorena]NEQ13731.1 helix-turn-helix transcriptional regulator [Moorena sp. SIO3E2]EGJ32125.1 two-component response regulator, CheY subfamily [Moorena producens 3L]NEP34935.1 helix-turn-helix transcriptional regulator [Moorena sp. SIO3B2]NEP64661.1 helix-turn-helix transcriptional regulator [Moorena sp. SIO3A5]NEQ10801.1 helix-turn-helix transcriptional regulator [Moorena sp. SIO4E2]